MKECQRLGKKKSEEEGENVSDMKLSACVTLGQISFHLCCDLVMQMIKKSPNLNLAFTPTCISVLSHPGV